MYDNSKYSGYLTSHIYMMFHQNKGLLRCPLSRTAPYTHIYQQIFIKVIYQPFMFNSSFTMTRVQTPKHLLLFCCCKWGDKDWIYLIQTNHRSKYLKLVTWMIKSYKSKEHNVILFICYTVLLLFFWYAFYMLFFVRCSFWYARCLWYTFHICREYIQDVLGWQ